MFRTILFSSDDNFIDKFVGLLPKPRMEKLSAGTLVVFYFYPIHFQGKFYDISFSLYKVAFSPANYWENYFSQGADILIIHTDENDVDYVSKLREAINRFKSYNDAKFLLVFDNETKNKVIKENIKSLQEDNTIQGVYGINFTVEYEIENFFREVIKVYSSEEGVKF